jgi:hypothetical protein
MDWRQGTAAPSSECLGCLELAVRASLRARAPLLRSVCPSKTALRSSVVWVQHSRLVVRPPRGFQDGGTRSVERGDLPRTSTPLQSLTRDPRCQRKADTRTLPRFFAPAALPSVEIYHSQALPAWVTLRPRTYHVPRRLTPSTDSLVSFQPGALSGRYPSELYLTEIAVASRRGIPSCD